MPRSARMVNVSSKHWRYPPHAGDDVEEPPRAGQPRVMTTPSAPQADRILLSISNSGDRFDEQIALFKSLGADFDIATKTWWVEIERMLTGDRPGIDVLFEAAKEYGTIVRLERLSPTVA